MSWDAYKDNLKAPDQNGMVLIQDCAIVGCAPGQESVWTCTPGFNVTVDEIKKLCTKDRSSFYQNGVFLAGRKCRLLRDNFEDDKEPVLLLKTAPDGEGNSYSVTIRKTTTAFVIGVGSKEAQGGQVNTKVNQLADYLRGLNY